MTNATKLLKLDQAGRYNRYTSASLIENERGAL